MSGTSSLTQALNAAGLAHAVDPDGSDLHESLGVFDTSISYKPDSSVEAQSVEDVVTAVEVAQRENAPIIALGTGHGLLDSVGGGILLSTRGLAGVEIDVEGRTARVWAGTDWATVLAEATPHGLGGLCGSAPGVGVVGYLLGGGIGALARTFGYSSDYVRSIDIVTPADGLITASPTDHAELFWALRGGKGGFGVVTSIVIDLLPIETIYGGGIYYSATDAPLVMREFGAWASALPESATASIALLALPDAAPLPSEIRGQHVAHLRFASVEDPTAGAELILPMRAIGDPLLDLVGELPYSQIGSVHGDPTAPMNVMSGGMTLTGFEGEAADALLEAGGPQSGLPISAIEIRSLGGAAERDAEVPSAVGARDAAFNLFVSGAPLPTSERAVVDAAVRSVMDAAAPWRGDQNLINFVGAANSPDDVAKSWSDAQNERLNAARALADPSGLFPFAGHGPN